jgi:membrane fusion protein, multidrug efflux system
VKKSVSVVLHSFKPISIVIFFTLLFFSCSPKQNNTAINDDLKTNVVILQPKDIEVPKTYVSDIQAIQYVEIRARVEGFLENIDIDEGDAVKKDQVLFRLSSNEQKDEIAKAEANLRQAKAEAKNAALELERIKALVDKDIVSKTELDVAKANKDFADAEIQEAESQLNNARINFSYTLIKAPFDGIVDRILLKKGSLISAGDLLTSITDITEIYAYYKVTENEYLSYMREKIESKSKQFDMQEVHLLLSDGSKYQHVGFIETMEADFEQGTGSIAFRAKFPNPDKLLKHGASGRVVQITKLDSVYLIPQKSTYDVQDLSYAYILNDSNKVEIRSFKPLARFKQFYITNQFKPGTKLIVEGIQSLQNGQLIMPNIVSIDSISIL